MDSAEENRLISAYGTCGRCGAPRDAVMIDDELALVCTVGHPDDETRVDVT